MFGRTRQLFLELIRFRWYQGTNEYTPPEGTTFKRRWEYKNRIENLFLFARNE